MSRSSSTDDKLLEGGLRIGYKTDRYDIAGFVRNITNDESAVSAIDFNNFTGMVNEPRIWGVEVGLSSKVNQLLSRQVAAGALRQPPPLLCRSRTHDRTPHPLSARSSPM